MWDNLRGVVCAGSRVYSQPMDRQVGLDPAGRSDTLASMAAGIQIAVRLPAEMVREIDQLAEDLSKPWAKVSRSDVLRAACEAGLPVVRQQADIGEPERKKKPR